MLLLTWTRVSVAGHNIDIWTITQFASIQGRLKDCPLQGLVSPATGPVAWAHREPVAPQTVNRIEDKQRPVTSRDNSHEMSAKQNDFRPSCSPLGPAVA